MISKELLYELGYGKVTHIGNVVGLYNMDCLQFKCERIISSGRSDGKFITTNTTFHIAIEVLAYKCKEWAYTKYKIILTSKLFDYQIKNIFDCYLETGEKSRENIRNFAHPDFISNTEPEAIFKACQWILENK